MFNRNSACFEAALAMSFLMLISNSVVHASGQSQMSWEQLNKELEKTPNDANLWLMRGQILARTFEDKEAIDCYTKAIKLNPTLAQAYLGRGDAYLTFEKAGDALNDYIKARALLKSTPGAKGYYGVQSSLARCYKSLKQYSLELPIRLEVAKSSGGANDWAGLADCQMRNELFKEAAISYQNAIKKNPLQIDLHRQYGDYFVTRAEYANGVQEFSRAIALATAEHALDISSNYNLFQRRADCYDKLGHSALATQDRRRAQNWQESIFDAAPTQDPRIK